MFGEGPKSQKLNSFQLKIIAAAAMFLGHFAYVLEAALPEGNPSRALITCFDIIGRITMPIMCFFIAEGLSHTKNFGKYLMRLLVFGFLSQIPFALFRLEGPDSSTGEILAALFRLNVLFTLAAGLAALWIWRRKNLNPGLKIAIIGALILSTFCCDYPFIGVLWILIFGVFQNRGKAFLAFGLTVLLRFAVQVITGLGAAAVIPLFALLALPLISLYDGSLGRKSGYFFYIFYPAHLLILALVKFMF